MSVRQRRFHPVKPVTHMRHAPTPLGAIIALVTRDLLEMVTSVKTYLNVTEERTSVLVRLMASHG